MATREIARTYAQVLFDLASAAEALRENPGGSVSPEVLTAATLAVERGHEGLLAEVARLFGEIAEAERGIAIAEVATAVAIDDQMRAVITDRLAAAIGRPVTLRERVDSSIIGGIIIKVGGRVLDGSISSQLDAIRLNLSGASQGGEA